MAIDFLMVCHGPWKKGGYRKRLDIKLMLMIVIIKNKLGIAYFSIWASVREIRDLSKLYYTIVLKLHPISYFNGVMRF